MEGKLTMTEDQLNDFFEKNEVPGELKETAEVAVTEKKAEITLDDLYKEAPQEVTETKEHSVIETTVESRNANEKDQLMKQIEFFKTKEYLPEDFILPDDEELTQDLFGEVLEYSTNYIRDKIYNDVVQSTGRQGQAIIEYINNGGDAEKIVDLFKNQQQVQFLNIETIDGQKKIITDFYKEQDWNEDDIEDFIDNKINSDKLQKEAERIKIKRDVESDKKISKELENQEGRRIKELQIINSRKVKFAETLKTDYKQTDIRNIMSFVFDENTDNNLTDFELKILDIQKKPNELKELVEYLVDPEVFIKKRAVAIQNKKTETTWSKINTAKSKKSDFESGKESTSSKWIFNN